MNILSQILILSLTAGVASDSAANRKCEIYAGLSSSYSFQPIAFETLGAQMPRLTTFWATSSNKPQAGATSDLLSCSISQLASNATSNAVAFITVHFLIALLWTCDRSGHVLFFSKASELLEFI